MHITVFPLPQSTGNIWDLLVSNKCMNLLVYQMVLRAHLGFSRNWCNLFVYATLRSAGFISVAYIDDSLFILDTAEHCSKNVNETIHLLSELGFTINYEKSVLIPSHSIKFLGFIFDSNTMTIRPTSETLSKLKDINNKIPTVYNLSSFIGFIVSNFPAAKYCQLHYRNLETNMSNALKANRGNYRGIACLTQHSRAEIISWLSNADMLHNDITTSGVEFVLTTDV